MQLHIPRKIKIILNPSAGGGRGKKLYPLIKQKLLERKVNFQIQFSENAQHATFLSRQAQSEGFNIIVSAGGDGTAHNILQAMVGGRSALGFIPLGTGNDFAGNLGITEDLDKACDILSQGKVRRIDLIQINSDHYMAGVGGIGFDSEVNAVANKLSRFLKGRAAYVFPVLLKILTYKPKEVTLSLDREIIKGSILMVAFGNIRSYGKGMQITPLAELDDGFLDICWIDPVRILRLYRFFPLVFSGEHIEMPEVHYYRSTSVQVSSVNPLDLYGDGEFICRTPFSLKLIPQALRVLTP